MRHLISISIILLMLGVSACFAQSSIEAKYHYGYLLPHRASMQHLSKNMTHVAEIRLGNRFDNNEPWELAHKHPNVDFGLSIFDLGNPQILGYGFSLAAIYSSPLINKPNFEWCLELGAGPGVVTKPFDHETNTKNIAIGSYLNVFATAGTKIAYRLSKHIWTTGAVSFNHFSNSSFSLPNLGLNYPLASVGLKYEWKEKKQLQKRDTSYRVESVWQSQLFLGIKEINQPRNRKYLALTGSFGRRIGLDEKRSLLLNLDLFHNLSYSEKTDPNGDKLNSFEITQLGTCLLYQSHINKTILYFGVGAYLIDQIKTQGWWYKRAGIMHFVTEHLAINLSMKAHNFKADYFEIGLAHTF